MYDYYKALPEKWYGKELPDTVEEMQPLFIAVAHGCAAGLHQQTLEEVYWPRIKRNTEHYLAKKLGTFNDDLAAVAHFFTTPWHTPAAGLEEIWQAGVLNWVGFLLRALGRLREALEPMQANIEINVKRENWKSAAINTSNLGELQLTLGDVATAVVSGRQSVGYADESGDLICRMGLRAIYANALHQAGETARAFETFIAAEKIQQEWQPEIPRMYSLQGFLYSDLLLAQDEVAAVLERAKYDLDCWTNYFSNGSLLDFSLPKLTLGCAHRQQGGQDDFSQAIDWLDQAVAGLRAVGQNHYLTLGLLARAALHCDTRNPNHDFTCTHQDLQEVFDIVEPSGMRLYLTDYHLEMARLLIAEQENPPQSPVEKGESAVLSVQEHVAEAAKLIEETGYKRRLPELVELQNKLATK